MTDPPVPDLTVRVAAALERSVMPVVIARGGAVRVAAASEDGVVTLEATGSPGAVLPLAARIEALIRAAVPEVTAVRLVAPGAAPSAPGSPGDTAADLAEAARQVLDAEVNPAIVAHRRHVTVAGADRGWIRIRLDGGCQGCSLAEVTIRQGIEPLLRARLPAMTGLIDVTDHEAGTDPFFSPEKR
jgi:Fe-S cluster biogenesis protein NfuA